MARVAVVGSYGVGLSFVSERFPASGETVLAEAFRIDHGGKGSNQAVGAARLGAEVSFLTALGRDAFGERARELWKAECVAATVVESDAPTMAGAILVDSAGENRIVIAPGALAALTPATVDRFEPAIAAADVCLVSLEIPLDAARQALSLARASAVRAILNPAPAPPPADAIGLLELAEYITPNELEAAAVGSADHPAAVVTLGAAGARWRTELVPAFTAVPVDTTGAGDAFNAAFAVAIGEGADILAAMRFGCAAGAHMVEREGVLGGLPSRAELLERLSAPTSAVC